MAYNNIMMPYVHLCHAGLIQKYCIVSQFWHDDSIQLVQKFHLNLIFKPLYIFPLVSLVNHAKSLQQSSLPI